MGNSNRVTQHEQQPEKVEEQKDPECCSRAQLWTCLQSFCDILDFCKYHFPFSFNGKDYFTSKFTIIVSLLLIGTTIGLFFSSIKNIATYKLQNIQTNQINPPSDSFIINQTPAKNNIFFLFFIKDQNVLKKYLSVKVYNKTRRNQIKMEGQTKTIKLKRCDQYDWSKLDSNLPSQLEKINLSESMCTDPSEKISIAGFRRSNLFQYLSFEIGPCDENMNSCSNSSQFNDYLSANQYFQFNFYYIEMFPKINQIEDYIDYKLRDRQFFRLTTQEFIEYNYDVFPYKIETDISIENPFNPSLDVYEGIQLRRQEQRPAFNTTAYLKVYVKNSGRYKLISRKAQKVFNIIQDIGGFIAIFIIVYSIGQNYNKYCAYLYISNFLFRLKTQKTQKTQKTMKTSDMKVEQDSSQNIIQNLQGKLEQQMTQILQVNEMDKDNTNDKGFHFLYFLACKFKGMKQNKKYSSFQNLEKYLNQKIIIPKQNSIQKYCISYALTDYFLDQKNLLTIIRKSYWFYQLYRAHNNRSQIGKVLNSLSKQFSEKSFLIMMLDNLNQRGVNQFMQSANRPENQKDEDNRIPLLQFQLKEKDGKEDKGGTGDNGNGRDIRKNMSVNDH